MAKKSTTPTKNKDKKSFNVFTYIKWFWILFATGIVAVVFIFLLASWGVFGEMPTFEELENPQNDLATQIISADGKQIGTFFRENRTPVLFEDLPDHVVEALIATEDARYYEHSGIDARGTLRAILFLGSRGGASTITQQLAKQLFTGGSQNRWERYLQKVQEWVIATRLERQYTKQEIIAMYLNKYDFLNQAIGIGSASRIYFNRANPKQLKIEEAATLVGMLKNSSLYNPRRRPELVETRRNTVLAQMAKYGYLSEKEKDSLQAIPLKLDYNPEDHDDGIATYFRQYVRDWVSDWAKAHPKGKDEEGNDMYFDIYRDGLRINVSIDSRMQKYAEEAVREHMANLQKEFLKQEKTNKTSPFRDISSEERERIIMRGMKNSDRYYVLKQQGMSDPEIFDTFTKKTEMKVFSWDGYKDTIMTPRDSILYHKAYLRSGLMSMEPQTGYIKAWVGGVDYKYFKYDQVNQGARQVGSTFKPFVYATAIDQLKLSPCDTLPVAQVTIPAGKHGVTEDWTPKNSDGEYAGYLSLKDALAQSVNTVSARLMDRIGPETIIRLARKSGIESDIQPVASIALGSVDLKLSEMVGAYSTFANQGIYTKPVTITSIQDSNGTILYQFVPETRDVISKEAAFVTINLMEGVTQSGSGVRLRTGPRDRYDFKNVITGYPYLFENPIAGKTGTTQNQSDGWFMGIVPNLCTGVWVGGEERATHFSSTQYGQGATMALPIWALYMKKCYADKALDVSKEAFPVPENLTIQIDCEEYKKTTEENIDVDEEFGF
ncbi:penicillin-binding protein 1A [Aquimarina brevivitae]|uniref:Penicillin-binding protein 1A n=1 Tax=Aquimarina brevivitae TaxID=323412 RepID=A0A4Q7PGB8_9FLAO|nr:transglycosylase domain-containing protein [Aquimarina brevivitae]RZS99187.1 penicillin-binding protein 1A [Aquimarina brevivitae]